MLHPYHQVGRLEGFFKVNQQEIIDKERTPWGNGVVLLGGVQFRPNAPFFKRASICRVLFERGDFGQGNQAGGWLRLSGGYNHGGAEARTGTA